MAPTGLRLIHNYTHGVSIKCACFMPLMDSLLQEIYISSTLSMNCNIQQLTLSPIV